jgi:hypothetical protein
VLLNIIKKQQQANKSIPPFFIFLFFLTGLQWYPQISPLHNPTLQNNFHYRFAQIRFYLSMAQKLRS